MRKHELHLRGIVANEGARVLDTATTGSGHIRIKVADGARTGTLIAGGTPSDWRGV